MPAIVVCPVIRLHSAGRNKHDNTTLHDLKSSQAFIALMSRQRENWNIKKAKKVKIQIGIKFHLLYDDVYQSPERSCYNSRTLYIKGSCFTLDVHWCWPQTGSEVLLHPKCIPWIIYFLFCCIDL